MMPMVRAEVYPAKAMAMTTAVSTAWPVMVEPMVRVQSQRPRVRIFILARVKELVNSPAQYAMRDAMAKRGTRPKTVAKACWLGHPGAAGRATAMAPMTESRAMAKKPIQMARREAA